VKVIIRNLSHEDNKDNTKTTPHSDSLSPPPLHSFQVPVTESSVEIAISSPHRASALEACASAIDQLKANIPIWKKEVYRGGGGGTGGATWKANAEAFSGVRGAGQA
jgi:hypothetical protein